MDELVLSSDELEKSKEQIVASIKKFVKNAGAKGAVCGLSGGVDSALVAVLAKLALKDRIQALIMPERGVTRGEDVEHAVMLADEHKIQYRIIELNEAIDAVKDKYLEILDRDKGFLARANLPPRIRMVFNYAVSNTEGLIVLGTGNKTELMLGYFTKYGDGGVDVLPIGDLYKTQVRQLACHLGLPECFIEKPPSAGLWHGQTDEEELGESYENIDKVLYLLHDRGYSIEKTVRELKLDRKVVEMIHEMTEKNKHKRLTPPVVELDFLGR
jgi:NAD+ synthase